MRSPSRSWSRRLGSAERPAQPLGAATEDVDQAMTRRIGTPVSRQTVVNSIDSPTAADAVARSTTCVAEPGEPVDRRLGEQVQVPDPLVAREAFRGLDDLPSQARPAQPLRNDDRAQEAGRAELLDRRRRDDVAAGSARVIRPGDHAELEGCRRALERQTGRREQRLDGRHVGRGRPIDAHQQHPVPPQQPPALAIGSVPDLADRSTNGGASAGFVALTIALTMPSATSWVGVSVTSTRPAASSPARNSRERQRARDAARVRAALGALLGRQAVLRDDVRDPHPAARVAARARSRGTRPACPPRG